MTIAIKPIHNDQDHAEAVTLMERLWDAVPGTPEHDALEILATLASAYEDGRWPVEPPDPVEAIKIRMEQTGRSRKDFAQVIGSNSHASEILNRRRRLTMDMVWRLNREWRIPAEVLVRPYELRGRDGGAGTR